ncbi:MAG TPA: hypothetical protein P5121_35370 [Caldilineaceae bacterium]|nr:hypothetical protein [Caldilineaceae bacterium]
MDHVAEIRRKIGEGHPNEKLVEQFVTYTLLKDDQVFIVENVPARVNLETGEQLFSPETVETLQTIIAERRKPKRLLQTPVYEFAGH